MDINSQAMLLDVLYQRHEHWQGVPYELGGQDQQGIDCSGFVALTFAEDFGIQLPRTTGKLAQLEGEIPYQLIQAGDLVVFDIAQQKKYYHVGIYLQDNQFLHASTSRGVMISDLTNDYWYNSLWKVIRVLD